MIRLLRLGARARQIPDRRDCISTTLLVLVPSDPLEPEDVSLIIVKKSTIACRARIPSRGSIKIEFTKIPKRRKPTSEEISI